MRIFVKIETKHILYKFFLYFSIRIFKINNNNRYVTSFYELVKLNNKDT